MNLEFPETPDLPSLPEPPPLPEPSPLPELTPETLSITAPDTRFTPGDADHMLNRERPLELATPEDTVSTVPPERHAEKSEPRSEPSEHDSFKPTEQHLEQHPDQAQSEPTDLHAEVTQRPDDDVIEQAADDQLAENDSDHQAHQKEAQPQTSQVETKIEQPNAVPTPRTDVEQLLEGEQSLNPEHQTSHEEVRRDRALTERVIDERAVIYDARGVPHVVGGPPQGSAPPIVLERSAFRHLDEELRRSGERYDPETGTGSEYLWQSDAGSLVPKGTVTLPDGSRTVTGTTADLIKVTRQEGRIVSVETHDVTSSNQPVSSESLAYIMSTVTSKLSLEGKSQAEKVVFAAANHEQANKVREIFAGNPNVHVIFPRDTV